MRADVAGLILHPAYRDPRGALVLARTRPESALVAAGGLAVLGAARVLPALWSYGVNPVPPCPFRLITGHPCPLCGATRSFAAMAHGDLLHAARLHPLGPLMFLAVIVLTLAAVWALARGRPLRLPIPPDARRVLLAVVVALFAASWLAKWVWLGP